MSRLSAAVCLFVACCVPAIAQDVQIRKGDHIAVIGNTTADRMQHHGWLETYIHALFPEHNLTFRNLGFPGDEVKTRMRSANFGTPDAWLAKVRADTVLCFFGYNEALRGADGLDEFRRDLVAMIDGLRAHQYNGESPPQIIVFSPIAHEDLNSPHLPDGSTNNPKLKLYTQVMAEVCEEEGVRFVDLFRATADLYRQSARPLTMNGVHLLDHGNKALAGVIISTLFGRTVSDVDPGLIERIREAVLDKNYYWFSRYRVVDGYNVFGGRSRLSWFGQSNADVMMREMEIFDVQTANRDKRVWAVALGGDLEVRDDNLPQELVVRTNKPGPLDGGFHPYLGGKEAISKMTIHDGMQVNLFASEEMFPRLINPVQIAVDTDSRLWASVWPSYPHWNPTQPRRDAIVILPDENQDGVADECIVFADELNSVTGFEFWGGGVLVAAPPEIWFLKDTDGDDRADMKIRMLQGVSSADTHHSANAVVIGPDGWMYWSRGIFNVANFETPTKTFRSGQSGVHRFNPRTFEFEFHFPIGPNPHGDVFDRWGYQFASDGTSGTGSYINIGKGVGNKQWYKKRVRPVPATGILSSSHFPPEHEGNFLICNAIGFLGVLQHKVKYNGADITAEEVEPILYSSDENFRPSDVEIGGDGALYVADWHNVLIGHMQHNMRDPNRDHEHGRIYRVTYKDRPLVKPAKMKGKPVREVCENFFAAENSTRYRARLELSGREPDAIRSEVTAFARGLDPEVVRPGRDEAQALLECLWVFEEQRIPNVGLLRKVFRAQEPRVRAAAIRTLGHWAGRVDGWAPVLMAAATDDSALVRAEALKAAVEFDSSVSAEVIFKAASRPTDPELDTVIKYAVRSIDADKMIADSIESGKPLSPAAQAYALQNASASLLLKMERTDAVYEALLSRSGIPAASRWEAIRALANQTGRSSETELIARIAAAEKQETASLGDLAAMLPSAAPERLAASRSAITDLAETTKHSDVRTAAYSAWVRSGDAVGAWNSAVQDRAALSDLLAGLTSVPTEKREVLFQRVQSLAVALPKSLSRPGDDDSSTGPPVAFEYFEPNPAKNVALETLAAVRPRLTGRLPGFRMFVPGGRKDAFATKQTAAIRVPADGEYTFFTATDDGSRLYINGQLVVNNDGLHGMSEKSGRVSLSAGLHEITVTYFENGGGDGFRISWAGPGIEKQQIPDSVLRPGGSGSPRVQAIELLAAWPEHADQSAVTLAELIVADDLAGPALSALTLLPPRTVAARLEAGTAADILTTVLQQAAAATPVERQSAGYAKLLNLGDALVATMDTPEGAPERRLRTLRASIPVKADPEVMALGREVYLRESHCATCHQPHGQGLPNLYPPLDGSLWATGSADRMISLVLDGMHGTIEVKGKRYSSPPLPPMTGFRQLLDDQEIAAVLTYVRNSWSNRARPVSTQQVAAIRQVDRGDATFWYANDLLEKYPLEDGRKPIELADKDRWVPRFVRKWGAADVDLSGVSAANRSRETGRLYFKRLGCIQCHQLNGEGGVFGPDLTKLKGKKKTAQHVLKSIVNPSHDVDAQYATRQFILESGKIVTGLVAVDKPSEYHVITDPLAPNKPTVVRKSGIEEEVRTKTSIMPEGMLNWLTEPEILDLVAYVLSAGQ